MEKKYSIGIVHSALLQLRDAGYLSQQDIVDITGLIQERLRGFYEK
jgi:hypothetical protein